jgi:hypothetical protein
MIPALTLVLVFIAFSPFLSVCLIAGTVRRHCPPALRHPARRLVVVLIGSPSFLSTVSGGRIALTAFTSMGAFALANRSREFVIEVRRSFALHLVTAESPKNEQGEKRGAAFRTTAGAAEGKRLAAWPW